MLCNKEIGFLGGYSTTHTVIERLLRYHQNFYPQSALSSVHRSARRNGAYSEEPDGGMLLELALNPPLQLSPESVRSSRPVVASMPSKDGDVARKGKAAALPEVVLGLPPSSSTLSSGPRYQDQVV